MSTLTERQTTLLKLLPEKDRALIKYGVIMIQGRQCYLERSRDAVPFAWSEKKKLWVETDDTTLKNSFFDQLDQELNDLAKKLREMDGRAMKVWTDLLGIDGKDLEKLLESAVDSTRTCNKMNQLWPAVRETIKANVVTMNDYSTILPLKGGNKIDLRTGEITPRTVKDLWNYEIQATGIDSDPESEQDVLLYYRNLCRCHGEDGSVSVDEDLLRYLQSIHGYWMTKETFDKAFYVITGTTNSGKSQMLKRIKYILTANRIGGCDRQIFAKPKSESSHSSHLIAVKPYSMAFVSELEDGKELNSAGMKELTGDDTVTARQIYGRTESFDNTCKLVLAAQGIMKVDGSDPGIETRLRRIVLNYNQVNGTQEERKTAFDLFQRLHRPNRINANFAWYVAGARRILAAQSLGGVIAQAQCVTADSKEVITDGNSFQHFLDVCADIWHPQSTDERKLFCWGRDSLQTRYKDFCVEHSYTGTQKLNRTQVVDHIKGQFPGQSGRDAFKGLRPKEVSESRATSSTPASI